MAMNNPYEAYRRAAMQGAQRTALEKPMGTAATQSVAEDVDNGTELKNIEPEKTRERLPDVKPSFEPAYQEKDNQEIEEEEKPLNPYFVNSVMTATPEKLTLMLYDGCLRFLNENITHIQNKDFYRANKVNGRARDIITELMSTLNMDYDISQDMFRLYAFMLDTLSTANVKKDTDLIREVIGLVQEFRDTWAEAMKIAKLEQKGQEAK